MCLDPNHNVNHGSQATGVRASFLGSEVRFAVISPSVAALDGLIWVLTADSLAKYYGAGNLTCVQVAGFGMPDNPMPEIGLPKGALPGDNRLPNCIQV